MDTNKLIRIALVIMGIFLLMDSGVHLFILRLKDVDGVWPNSALAFSRFLSQIYGSFTLLTALIIISNLWFFYSFNRLDHFRNI